MRNLAASVRQRLLNLSRKQKRPFQEVLQFYVMERFLYRLSQSEHANRLVLKGALLLRVWDAPHSRPTMDIDMLGRAKNDPEAWMERARDVFETIPVEDGVEFKKDSLAAENITKEAEYQGLRLWADAILDRARARLQLDIGFGDVVFPPPVQLSYPVLLDLPAPRLLCYSRESAIAEKFQAMVSLGALNSRMKDFYDIWLLSRRFEFEGKTLGAAVEATFSRRNTELPQPPFFDESFAAEKQIQWEAFIRRLGLKDVETDFSKILSELEMFLGKPADPAGLIQNQRWPAGGPWKLPEA